MLHRKTFCWWVGEIICPPPIELEAKELHPSMDTWAFLLIARLYFLPAALTRVALHACPLAHAETSLPARVARLGAQTPVVPWSPRAVRFGSGEQKGTIRQPFGTGHLPHPVTRTPKFRFILAKRADRMESRWKNPSFIAGVQLNQVG